MFKDERKQIMNFTDLLTIVMPVYERKDFFLEAIESALNQTLKCEIIVVDNCSSHNYFEQICKQKGVTYYRNDSNIGLYGNYNRCFELAKTEYVMALDDDDRLSPIYVESFFKAKKIYPDIDIYFTNFNRITSKGILPHHHIIPFGYMKNGEKVIEYAIRYKLGFPLNTSSIKKIKFNGFETEFKGSNDWLWFYKNSDKFSIFGDARELFEFREHPSQDTKKNIADYNLSIPYIFDVVLKAKTSKIKLKKMASRNAFWALIRLKSSANKKVLDEMKNENIKYSNYLKDKLDDSFHLRIIFLMPSAFIRLAYKFFKKIRVFY